MKLQYSWWAYHFEKNPATIIFTKGYQARDKPKKLVGNPQEYKLLSSIVPFYNAEKGKILYVPAIYGYMLSDWKKSRTAELTIEIFIGLIADLATDGLFRYLRSVKYLDEVGDVMGAGRMEGVVEAGRKFTTSELALLKRADLPDFVSNNLDDLLLAENRTAIWNLNNVSSGQFKRGDLIEEIFNQWGNKYGGYQNFNDIIPNYRSLDFDGVLANANEVVSLKSYKPISNNALSSFKLTVRSNMKKLNDDVPIGTNHTGKSRVLDFTIEKGVWSQSQIDDVYDYIDDLLEDRLKFGNLSEVRITEF